MESMKNKNISSCIFFVHMDYNKFKDCTTKVIMPLVFAVLKPTKALVKRS